jgi:hypothetical protein
MGNNCYKSSNKESDLRDQETSGSDGTNNKKGAKKGKDNKQLASATNGQ